MVTILVSIVDPENLVSQQREIQRKYGRNVLRLQQYESLMKSLVAGQNIAGPASQLNEIRAQEIESTSKKTLGNVVGYLTKNYITLAVAETDSQQSDETSCEQEPYLSIKFGIQMAEHDFNRILKEQSNIVDLRNELVHHFLEHHDISSESGCQKADIYLNVCYVQINARFKELQRWVTSANDSRILIANLLATTQIKEFFLNEKLPGGNGDKWIDGSVVRLLTDAQEILTKDGWTLLQDAIDYIRIRGPEHTPKKHGCKTWLQVLKKSEQFDIQKVQAAPGLPTETWYRSRN